MYRKDSCSMTNILIINRKGGVGKTLIADELAFSLDAERIPYNFYDLDGQGGQLHEPCEMPGAEISIIDTPGALQAEMGEWIRDADVIIVPMRPTTTDMPATDVTMELIKDNAPHTPVIYVVNGTNRFRATQEFLEFFTEEHPFDRVYLIPQSESFVQAKLANESVQDYDPKGAPAMAMKAFTDGVWELLGVAV